jgi:putative Holliday junction resolvase
MGIDYGTKRIGMALSDESNTFALPYKVILNSKNTEKLLIEINDVILEKKISHIVIGESKNFQGQDNKVMKEIRSFKELLENTFSKPVIFEPEFMTSQQASSVQGEHALLDASAAAIILQSYLDRFVTKKM